MVSYEIINNPKYNESYIGYISAETAEKIGLPSAVYKVRYTQYARPAETHGSLEVCAVTGVHHGQWFNHHASGGWWVGWQTIATSDDLINLAVNRKAKLITEAPTEQYSYLFSIPEGFSVQVGDTTGGTLSIPSWSKGIFITVGTADGILISVDTSGNLYTAFRNNNKWINGRKI